MTDDGFRRVGGGGPPGRRRCHGRGAGHAGTTDPDGEIPRHRGGAFRGPGYSEMVTGTPETRSETAEMLAAVGIVATEEGRERARKRLADADARMTPREWAKLRARLRPPTVAE